VASKGNAGRHGGVITNSYYPSQLELLALATQIRTFTETTDPADGSIIAMNATVIKARQIVFLGFAFHELNVRLLWPMEFVPGHTRCLGTACGISKDDLNAIRAHVAECSRLTVERINLQPDLRSARLMADFSRVMQLK
jgi:hypothetical protein